MDSVYREKLKPKKPVKPQAPEDLSIYSKANPVICDIPMTSHIKSQWESDERAKAFKWWFNRETHARGQERDSLEEIRPLPLTLKPFNTLYVQDSLDPIQTVEEKKHLVDLAKAQMLSQDAPIPPLRAKPLKRLGMAMVMMGGLVVAGWLLQKIKL